MSVHRVECPGRLIRQPLRTYKTPQGAGGRPVSRFRVVINGSVEIGNGAGQVNWQTNDDAVFVSSNVPTFPVPAIVTHTDIELTAQADALSNPGQLPASTGPADFFSAGGIQLTVAVGGTEASASWFEEIGGSQGGIIQARSFNFEYSTWYGWSVGPPTYRPHYRFAMHDPHLGEANDLVFAPGSDSSSLGNCVLNKILRTNSAASNGFSTGMTVAFAARVFGLEFAREDWENGLIFDYRHGFSRGTAAPYPVDLRA